MSADKILVESVRPLPAEIAPTLRESILRRLDSIDGAAVVVSVDYENDSGKALLMVMGKERSGWSFAGWLEHEIRSNHTAAGFEVRKVWGS